MLIVFEGIDGSGKTTLAHAVKLRLSEMGLSATVTSEFGRKEAWSVEGRAALLAARDQIEQYEVVMRTRMAHAAEVLGKSAPDTVVLMDRYLASTMAYQHCPAVPMSEMRREHAERNLPTPALVFFITISPEAAMRRRKSRSSIDAIDAKHAGYFDEVSKLFYEALFRLKLIDGWKFHTISGEHHITDLVNECVDKIMHEVRSAPAAV